MTIEVIQPQWDAPVRVRAVSTTRRGGVSQGAWRSLNLGDHVEDDPAAVRENRRRLASELGLPAEPAWLRQVHGTGVRVGDSAGDCADACCEDRPGRVCVVMTADCLPVLFCNRAGTRVAAAHAGWRGLLAGVLEATLNCFDDPPGQVMAWLGPAIGPEAFEVGDEVREAFLARDGGSAGHFRPHADGRWLADLYGLARRRLGARGVTQLSGGDYCTFSEPERFFSYRRDGITGRMASLVWLQS
jgi:hypothetical protein